VEAEPFSPEKYLKKRPKNCLPNLIKWHANSELKSSNYRSKRHGFQELHLVGQNSTLKSIYYFFSFLAACCYT